MIIIWKKQISHNYFNIDIEVINQSFHFFRLLLLILTLCFEILKDLDQTHFDNAVESFSFILILFLLKTSFKISKNQILRILSENKSYFSSEDKKLKIIAAIFRLKSKRTFS